MARKPKLTKDEHEALLLVMERSYPSTSYSTEDIEPLVIERAGRALKKLGVDVAVSDKGRTAATQSIEDLDFEVE